MVVDGNEDTSIFFKVLLMNHQHQNITTAKSPEEALALIEQKRIQFVITSWELPMMTGAAFIQRVKAKRQFSHIPFVIYSTKLSNDELKLTHELGFRNIIRFPADENEAFAVISHVVEIEENLDQVELIIRSADLLFTEKQYATAINELKPGLVKGSYYHRAQTLLGEIYYGQQKIPESEAAVREALGLDDTYPDALHLIAKIYTKTGRHAEAITMLQKMNLESPLNIQNLISMGTAQMDADQDEAAKASFDVAARIDAKHPGLKDAQGKLAFKVGDYQMARDLLHESENAEDIVRHLNNVAVGTVGRGQTDRGIQIYEVAIGILKDMTHNHALEYNLALALKKKGSLRQAFDILAKCYERVPVFEKAYAALVHLIKDMEREQIHYDRPLAERLKALHSQSKSV